MEERFTITNQQRMEMIMRGLSPLNPSHVTQFINKNGQIRASDTAAIERAKVVLGETINYSLGHSKDRGIVANEFREQYGLTEIKQPKTVQEQLVEDMQDYGGSGVLDTNMLLERAGRNVQQQPKQNTNVDVKKFKELGHSHTITYLNAFIMSLKNPSAQSRIDVYNKLMAIMKNQQKLQANPTAFKAYEQGCIAAEKMLYSKIKK